jgi:hypothetical protein
MATDHCSKFEVSGTEEVSIADKSAAPITQSKFSFSGIMFLYE